MRVLLFLLLPLVGNCPTHEINPSYNRILYLSHVIFYLESKHDSTRVGDGGRAVGIGQMHTVAVREANRLSGKSYTYKDRRSVKKTLEMFEIIQRHHNPTLDLIIAAKVWNGGPDLSANTKPYLKRLYAYIQLHRHRGLRGYSPTLPLPLERAGYNHLQSRERNWKNHHILRAGVGALRYKLERNSPSQGSVLQVEAWLRVHGHPSYGRNKRKRK